MTTPSEPDDTPRSAATSRRGYLVMVAVAAFATTFAQQRSTLGNYPILFYLKEHLRFGKEQVSEFFMWAGFAWNLKPLAGVLTDAFPIRGSRRRTYLILGGIVGGLGWAALAFVRDDYHAFLLVSMLLNAGLVLASTAMGGLQVEAGQLFGISGRVSSLRQVVMSSALIAGPLLGGWLARLAFGYTAGVGALVMLVLVGVAVGFRETTSRRSDAAAIAPPSPPGPTSADAGGRYRPSPAIGIGVGVLALAGTLSVLASGMLNVGISLFALLFVFLLVLGLAMARLRNPVLQQAQRQL